MKKTNNLTKRNLIENGIYTRELQYVTIEVLPEDAFLYEEKDTIDTVDFIIKRKIDLNDTINSVYDVKIEDMKKVMSYLVEIYAPKNYFERHIIEFGNIDNRCIENYKAAI